MIDCGRHKIVFQETKGIELVTSQEVVKEMKQGSTCFGDSGPREEDKH